MTKGQRSIASRLCALTKGRGRITAGRVDNVDKLSSFFIGSFKTAKGRCILARSLGILADDRGTLTLSLSTIADSNSRVTRCLGADTGCQRIVAHSPCIVVVGIGGGINGIDAVIVDAEALGHLFQLGHIDGVGVIGTGSHTDDLAGAGHIAITVHGTDGKGTIGGFPGRRSVFRRLAVARIQTGSGSPVDSGVAAQAMPPLTYAPAELPNARELLVA